MLMGCVAGGQGWFIDRYPGLFWASVMAWTGTLLYALNVFMKVQQTPQARERPYERQAEPLV